MATRDNIKKLFSAGSYPSEDDFIALIDLFIAIGDSVNMSQVTGLVDALSGKYDSTLASQLATQVQSNTSAIASEASTRASQFTNYLASSQILGHLYYVSSSNRLYNDYLGLEEFTTGIETWAKGIYAVEGDLVGLLVAADQLTLYCYNNKIHTFDKVDDHWTKSTTIRTAPTATDIANWDNCIAALSSEVSRAKAAESANATAIADETRRASAAESTNATAIAAESARAKSAEGSNATAIAAEETRAQAAEAANATATSKKQDQTQYSTMPTPSSQHEGKVIHYVGESGSQYFKNNYYKCVELDNTYKWQPLCNYIAADHITSAGTELPDGTLVYLLNTSSVSGATYYRGTIYEVQNGGWYTSRTSRNTLNTVYSMPDAEESLLGLQLLYLGTITSEYNTGVVYTCHLNTSTNQYFWSNSGTLSDANYSSADKSALDKLVKDVLHLQTSNTEKYTNSTPTVVEVGGIPAGTTFEGVTISEVFNMMLYPELFPSLTAPSLTLTDNIATLVEVGSTNTVTLSATFSRGTISPAYGTSGYRSGLPSSYVYTIAGVEDTVTSTALTNTKSVSYTPTTVGTTTWSCKVNYSTGEQPLSSKGNNYSTALTEGTTATKSTSTTAVYAFYATTSALGTLTKQTLSDGSAGYYEASMVADTSTSYQTIDLHEDIATVTGVMQLNTLSNTWEWINGSKTNSVAAFTASTTTHDNETYKRYTNNTGSIGARQLRFYII